MFFLKELPTQAMIARYGTEFSLNESVLISQRLNGLREYSLLLRKLEDYFTAQGLSQLRFLILIVIDREPGRDWLYAYEIAVRLDVSKPVLSRAVKKLSADRLLHSAQDEQDTRATLLTLTNKSKALLTSILPGYFDILTDDPTQENM